MFQVFELLISVLKYILQLSRGLALILWKNPVQFSNGNDIQFVVSVILEDFLAV